MTRRVTSANSSMLMSSLCQLNHPLNSDDVLPASTRTSARPLLAACPTPLARYSTRGGIMGEASGPFDTSKFINPAQVGGIEAYTIADGEGRGARALCVNTGGGLRYRVLVDRGLDIDQAFFNQHSLAFLTHKGVTRPT